METIEAIGGKLFIGGKEVLKGWESFSGWYWFATEYEGDGIWYGFVQGFEEEWGTFSESEINALGNMAWPIPKKNLPHSGRRGERRS